MVYTSFNEEVWYYWIISGGVLFSFVGLIIACICSCRKNDDKTYYDRSEFLGLPGMVTITHSENESFSRISTEALQTIALDTVDSGSKRNNTAKRSLPDIPKDKNTLIEPDSEIRDIIYEVTENIGTDISELYATVQDKSNQKKDITSRQISQQSSQDETASLYAKLKTPQDSTEDYSYAQVQNIPIAEINSHISNVVVDLSKPSTSSAHINPIAPPRSRRSSSHNLILESDIPAASAISGGIQANQDLPYMTPPLIMSHPQPPEPLNNVSQQQNFSGDSQDSKGYTSISVREPLANIIAQTKRAQRHPRLLTDPHYATVSDDSDEMYAAIDDQDKVYTSGSETYAQIQPIQPVVVEINRTPVAEVQQPSRTEENYIPPAPQPPSVDSLRHVAHAHSRQASSSSATSSVANPGSPKPEKRQANSPLPPPPENPMDMYAVVDKRNKNEDRSLRSAISVGKSLEDMYAKVMKKKREHDNPHLQKENVTSSASSIFSNDVQIVNRYDRCLEPSRASWSSHDSVEIQKRDALKEYVNGEIDAGYEAVSNIKFNHRRSSVPSDADYETLRPQGKPRILPIYSQPLKKRQISNASSEDPGYERVRIQRRPDIEVDTDTEPNYESMPHEPQEPNYASVCGSDLDPNYESVVNGDPNYESVKYMSLPCSDVTEPPYEQVNNLKHRNYERMKVDPNYEKIKNLHFDSTQLTNGDTDDDQYVQV